MPRTVAALYDTRSEAERARSRLISELRVESPRIIDKATAGAVDGLKIARSDAEAYRERVRRGSYLVVAQVRSGAPAKRIIELLEQSAGGPPDEVSKQQWGDAEQGVHVQLPGDVKAEERQEPAIQEPAVEKPGPQAAPDRPIEPQVAAATGPRPLDAAKTTAPLEEQCIPLVDEELRIGKRQVVGGGARVRSFMRETQAEEQVQLDEEVIEVKSRSCERHLTESDIEAAGLFKERTFEIAAMREEPVITKSAVIREEVIVSKRVKQRTETIRDSLRRTEVEIEEMP